MVEKDIINAEEKIHPIFLEIHKDTSKSAYQLKSKLNTYRFRRQISKCVELIPKNSKVLEVGVGCGYTMAMIKELRPDITIMGSDLNPSKSWNFLKKKGYKILIDDSTDSKQDDNSFDVVLSFGVMEHTNNPEKFLKEIHRVLKPNGFNIIFNLPTKYALNDFLARAFKIGGHEDRYTRRRIYNLLKKQEFKNISIKREFLIPAQVNRINKKLGQIFNKHYILIDKIDSFFMATPLRIFSQTFTITTKK